MKISLQIYIVLAFSWLTFFSFGNDELKQAKSLFDAKKYKQSLSLYEAQVDSTQHSANLYYNMALCHKELGNLGLSIWYLEKALLYEPYHKQSNALLAIQNELVNDDLDLATEFSAFNKIARGVPPIYLYFIGIICSLLGALALFTGLKKKKSTYYFFSLLTAVIVVLTMIMLWVQNNTFTNSGYGIVMENCTLKEKNDAESTDSFSVSEGLKLRIVEEKNDWYMVQVKRQHAFIPKSYLKKI